MKIDESWASLRGVGPLPSQAYRLGAVASPEVQSRRVAAGMEVMLGRSIRPRLEGGGSAPSAPVVAVPFLSDLGRLHHVEEPFGRGYQELVLRLLLGWNGFQVCVCPLVDYPRGALLPQASIALRPQAGARLQRLERAAAASASDLRFHVWRLANGHPARLGASTWDAAARDEEDDNLGHLALGCVQLLALLMGWPDRLREQHRMPIHCGAEACVWGHAGGPSLPLGLFCTNRVRGSLPGLNNLLLCPLDPAHGLPVQRVEVLHRQPPARP